MELITLPGGEDNPIYRQLEAANNLRHYEFLYSMIDAAIASDRKWLSHDLTRAINFHAIAGLHHEAGQYRYGDLRVRVGQYAPPPAYRVVPLMNYLVDWVNRNWDSMNFIPLASEALWQVNHIHPFINGNGRSARAVCYYILCVKAGHLLPGRVTLPEILGQEPVRSRYVRCLQLADKGETRPLMELVWEAVYLQLTGKPPSFHGQ